MNTHTDITPAPLVYNGEIIRARSEMLSLTDMWKSAGAPENKRPAEWARKEGATFIEFVAETHNVAVGHIMKSQRGKGGATFAHWQIGLAYAKYLSPEFHMWCNEVVRERMEGRAAATAQHLTKYDASIIGNIVKNCTGVVVRDQLAQLLPELVMPLVSACLAEQNFRVRRGKTAKEIWDAHGLPPKLRGTAVWFGNRLKEMGASIEFEGRYDRGGIAVRLFDPDKAETFLKNGLLHKAKVYASERMGQGRLRLVGEAQ